MKRFKTTRVGSTLYWPLLWLLGLGMLGLPLPYAQGGTLSLNGYASDASTYYEYSSNGFARLGLDSPAQPTHQSLRSLDDPNVIYNQDYDAFPNDNVMRLGSVQYDESGLVDGTGQAPVTSILLGVATDPFDPSFHNWTRYQTNTQINGGTGSLELLNGTPISASFTANITLEVVGAQGATRNGYYDGTFSVEGSVFQLAVEGVQNLDTSAGDVDVSLEWDFTGTIDALPSPADYDNDGDVDTDDYAVWSGAYGSTTNLAADGNGDGVVNAADYTVWRDALHATSNTAVPEPVAGVLACLSIGLTGLRTGRARHGELKHRGS